jgi:hypothetical protein
VSVQSTVKIDGGRLLVVTGCLGYVDNVLQSGDQSYQVPSNFWEYHDYVILQTWPSLLPKSLADQTCAFHAARNCQSGAKHVLEDGGAIRCHLYIRSG